MGITVAQALEIDELRSGEVRAGHQGLQRSVEQVSMLSTVLPARHQQVLYFTSDEALHRDPNVQCSHITTLAEQQSAGVVIPSSFMPYVATDTLNLADRLQFPVIEIASTVSYPQLVSSFTTLLMREQSGVLERQRLFQQQLIDLMLRGFGLEHLVRATALQVRRPVLVVGAHDNIEVSYGLEQAQRDQWHRLVTQNRPARPRVFSFPDEAGVLVRVSIAPLPGVQRPGWIVTTQDESFNQEQHLIIEQASAMLALDLIKHEMAAVAQHNRQGEVIERLLSDHYQTEEELLRDAEQIGWDLRRCLAIMVLHTEPTTETRRTHTPLRAVADVARQSCTGSIVYQRGEDVLVFVRFSGAAAAMKNRLREVADHLQQNLIEHDHRQCVVAVGSLVDSPMALRVSHQAACGALRLRPHLPGAPSLIFYDDAQLLIMLSDFAVRADVQEWLKHQIGSLIEYDQRNKTDLVHTLEIALDQGGVLNVTAEQLNIHPNTLKYRLQRVEEILQQNPLSSPYRLSYHIAAKLARLLS